MTTPEDDGPPWFPFGELKRVPEPVPSWVGARAVSASTRDVVIRVTAMVTTGWTDLMVAPTSPG
jgi:hypothetical protein